MEPPSALWPLPSSSCNSLPLLGLFLAFLALLTDFVKRRKTWDRYPPGPAAVPFLGNVLQMDIQKLPAFCTRTSAKFGNVYSLQICWSNIVVVNGLKAVKEALINKSEETADRPPFPIYKHLGLRENCEGVVIARYGHGWKDMRRFSLSTLRDFGLGKKSLEQRVIEEAGFLCSALESEEGHPFDPHYIVNNAVSNVICSITFGERFDYDDEKFRRLLHLFEDAMQAATRFIAQIANVVPVLLRIPGLARKVFKPQNEIFNCLKEIIEAHKESWDPAVKRDFIDAFLGEMEKVKEDPRSNFNDANLLFTTVDMFTAGTETTSTTLRWGLLYMLLYPDVQRRVHEEIDRVIGSDRRPKMEDQASLHFTNAVIHEIQRYGDILPLSLPHMAYRDTEIQGFFIPKGTTILTNLSSVLKEESLWERPLQFYPEHFLDADGKFVKQEAFMAFSAGRRVCLGEQLARMELFLFFTSLLQRFKFTIPRDQPRPKEDPNCTMVQSPHPYRLCATLR